MWCSQKGGVLSSGSRQVEASGGHVGGVTLPTWQVLQVLEGRDEGLHKPLHLRVCECAGGCVCKCAEV